MSSQIKFLQGDITKLTVDAIVNAANKTLLGGGGVDGAIHEAAGRELLNECRKLGGCRTGEAKITKAYNITAVEYIIHTVGPIYSGRKEDAEDLAKCYKNSLDLALQYKCRSIAFPCISTGVYHYPKEEAAKVSLQAAEDWFKEHRAAEMTVYFCCYGKEQLEIYLRLRPENK